MNFLSIDCSTEIGSLFIKFKNKSFYKILQSHKFANDLLVKKILDFLTENELTFDHLSNIFVNQGPGNFSGLRGSIAIAKGICLSKNIKLSGYDTFTWLGSKFFNKEDFIFSIIKHREKYYIKKIDKQLKSTSKIEEITKEQIIKNYNNKFKVIAKNESKTFDKKILELNNLQIIDLNHEELEFLHLKGLLNEGLVKPYYLS